MKRHALTRRSLLRRLGGAGFLATPVFREVLLEEARAAVPPRLLIVVFGGGARYNTPQGTSQSATVAHTQHNFTWEKNLAPLSPHRNDLRLFRSLGDFTRPGNTDGHVTLTLLTGDSRLIPEEEKPPRIPAGTNSIDQVIAAQIGRTTRFASLQLGVATEAVDGADASGRVSIANGSILAPVTDPRAVFARLFGGAAAPSSTPTGTSQADPEAAAALQRLHDRKKSILDLRQAEIAEIKAIAGSAELAKLDQHLTGIRELEKGLPALAQSPGGGVSSGGPGTAPAGCAAPMLGAGADLRAVTTAMNELTYQALQCDLTRVITLHLLNSGEDIADYGFLGVRRKHHTMQHEPADDLDVTQTWLMSMVAALIQRCKDSREGDATLLDNLGMVVLSEQADGRDHTAIPTLGFVAGRAGGAFRAGGTDLVGNASPLNDLWVGLARAYGVNLSSFGEARFNKNPLSLA